MDSSFDSAWIKWVWGIGHAQAFYDELQRFICESDGKYLMKLTATYEPKRHGFAVVAAEVPMFPVRCSTLLGDTVHSYRSCLDHIAWALVERGSTPPRTLAPGAQRRIQFPLELTRAKFDSNLAAKPGTSRMPGLTKDDKALVRAEQPYHQGRWMARFDALAVLAELSNLDKHRRIQPIVHWPGGGGRVEISDPYDCAIDNERQVLGVEQTIGANTELGLLHVRKTGPNPRVRVEASIPMTPAVYERCLVERWLLHVQSRTLNLLSELSAPPADVERLGIDITGFGVRLATHLAEG